MAIKVGKSWRRGVRFFVRAVTDVLANNWVTDTADNMVTDGGDTLVFNG